MRILNEQILTHPTLYKVITLIVLAAIMVLMLAFGLSHLSGPELAGGGQWDG